MTKSEKSAQRSGNLWDALPGGDEIRRVGENLPATFDALGSPGHRIGHRPAFTQVSPERVAPGFCEVASARDERHHDTAHLHLGRAPGALWRRPRRNVGGWAD